MIIHLIGRAWPNITYAKGWDRLTPREESLTVCVGNQIDESGKLVTTIFTYTHSIYSKF